jgi:hypothetical protein
MHEWIEVIGERKGMISKATVDQVTRELTSTLLRSPTTTRAIPEWHPELILYTLSVDHLNEMAALVLN